MNISPQIELLYTLYTRNSFMILKKKNTGSLSVNKDHVCYRNKRELLKLIEKTLKKSEVQALVGVSWGFVGERILKDISSVVNSGSDLLTIELEDSGTYIDHKSHILLFNKHLRFLLLSSVLGMMNKL